MFTPKTMLFATGPPMRKPPDTASALLARLGDEHGESLFDCLDDVQFWVKDALGRYLRVNGALVKNYGFADASAVIGKTDRELFPPHLADQYLQDDRQVLAGHEIRDRVELVGRPDRSTAWHVTNKIPLRGRDGRVVASAGITRLLDVRSPAGVSVTALAPVVERIRARYAEPLDKPRLARLIGMSVRSLERRFVAAFAIPLLAYQRTLRMHRACQMLVTGDDSITAIALSLGYGDHSHFTREFGKFFGTSPRAYRKRWSHRGGMPLPVTAMSPSARSRDCFPE